MLVNKVSLIISTNLYSEAGLYINNGKYSVPFVIFAIKSVIFGEIFALYPPDWSNVSELNWPVLEEIIYFELLVIDCSWKQET